MLADRIAGLSLSDWAIIVGIACTVITCAVNWYFRWKEREDRHNGYATKLKNKLKRSGRWFDSCWGFPRP